MSIHEEVTAVARKVQPLGSRVFVRVAREARQVGRIILPDGGKSLDLALGEVMARGPLCKLRPWELAVGDFVLFARPCGVAYDGTLGLLGKMSQTGGQDAGYKFILESELIAVVAPELVGKIVGEINLSGGRTGTRDMSTV